MPSVPITGLLVSTEHPLEKITPYIYVEHAFHGLFMVSLVLINTLHGRGEEALFPCAMWEDLEKEMATHSNTLAWKIPWMQEPGRLQSMGRKELDTTEWLHFLSIVPFGGGNGNPLQYSCLEKPVGRGAWWATVYGVSKSRTWLSK